VPLVLSEFTLKMNGEELIKTLSHAQELETSNTIKFSPFLLIIKQLLTQHHGVMSSNFNQRDKHIIVVT